MVGKRVFPAIEAVDFGASTPASDRVIAGRWPWHWGRVTQYAIRGDPRCGQRSRIMPPRLYDRGVRRMFNIAVPGGSNCTRRDFTRRLTPFRYLLRFGLESAKQVHQQSAPKIRLPMRRQIPNERSGGSVGAAPESFWHDRGHQVFFFDRNRTNRPFGRLRNRD